MRGLVITPTFNEIENIERHIASVLSQDRDLSILRVDDESPDRTALRVAELAENNARVFLLNHGKKNGLGRAYVDGFEWAIKHDFSFVIEMDADASHPYEALPEMICMASAYDCVIGSRYIPGGKVVDWSLSRKFLSKLGNWVARKFCSLPPHDVTGGFRLIRVSLLASINLKNIESRGYAFQVDLLRKLFLEKCKWIEVPIEFKDRELGKSKMSAGIILEAGLLVCKWGFWRIFAKEKI